MCAKCVVLSVRFQNPSFEDEEGFEQFEVDAAFSNLWCFLTIGSAGVHYGTMLV